MFNEVKLFQSPFTVVRRKVVNKWRQRAISLKENVGKFLHNCTDRTLNYQDDF